MLTLGRKPVYPSSKLLRSCDLATPLCPKRTYTLPRSSHKNVGFGRNKALNRTPQRKRQIAPLELADIPVEKASSTKESPLWRRGQDLRAIAPEHGLGQLLLRNDKLVVTRQLEMLNVFVGFEQANKYAITTLDDEPVGFIAEEPRGLLSTFSRQIFRTHRPFRALVMDLEGHPVLWLRRPFSFVNSRMFVQTLAEAKESSAEGEHILNTLAEVQQRWHLWRRRYDLFLRGAPHRILSLASDPQPEPESETDLFNQVFKIDEGFLAWHFKFLNQRGEEVANVDRQFRGFGREIFTDTGRYLVHFGPTQETDDVPSSASRATPVFTLDQRALILAMAVNIDFDYFSRHSGGGGGVGFGAWTFGGCE